MVTQIGINMDTPSMENLYFDPYSVNRRICNPNESDLVILRVWRRSMNDVCLPIHSKICVIEKAERRRTIASRLRTIKQAFKSDYNTWADCQHQGLHDLYANLCCLRKRTKKLSGNGRYKGTQRTQLFSTPIEHVVG